MIILEGPDNSGKSTLASYLSYELDIPIYHAGGPPASVREMMKRVQFIFENHDRYIFDRIPLISEPIYCILRGGDNMFEGMNGIDLYSELRALNPILVYCKPPLEVLLEEDPREAKPHDTATHIQQMKDKKRLLIERYDEVINREYMPEHHPYDYTTTDHERLLRSIKDEILKVGHYKGKALRPSNESKQGTEGGQRPYFS